jgi:hypothetical protein
MANSKLSAFFSLLLVFCSGAVVGVFSYRVYNTSVAPPARPAERSPEDARKALIAEMTREVRLDDQQVAKLGQIYDDTRERFTDVNKNRSTEFRTIWDDQIKQIKDMLRPDQVPLYDALRVRKDAERDAERKKRGRKGGIQPGEPGGKDKKN